MKAKTAIFSMALLIAFLLLGCSNDEDISSSSSKFPKAPSGAKTQYLFPGSTVSDIKVTGSNIRWYLNLSDPEPVDDSGVETNSFVPGKALSPDTPVNNNTTYYATQTLNGVQSRDCLAVKVYWLERY